MGAGKTQRDAMVVIPAKAGNQLPTWRIRQGQEMGCRLRGNDDLVRRLP